MQGNGSSQQNSRIHYRSLLFQRISPKMSKKTVGMTTSYIANLDNSEQKELVAQEFLEILEKSVTEQEYLKRTGLA